MLIRLYKNDSIIRIISYAVCTYNIDASTVTKRNFIKVKCMSRNLVMYVKSYLLILQERKPNIIRGVYITDAGMPKV